MASTAIPTDIAFEGTYVLTLQITLCVFELTLDLLLMPDHPAYTVPAKGERACFRRGTLRISDFRNLQWSATGAAPARDATGELDWGYLDEFTSDNENWRVGGDWGVISVEGGQLTISLD